MSEEDGRERPYAIDYTPIVKHRSKQFTMGDVSLSKINGVDLQSASVAVVPAVAVGCFFAVMFALLGVTVFIALMPAIIVFLAVYLWFSRETIDPQSPWDRVLMAITVGRHTPVKISGGGPTVKTSNALSEMFGAKHFAADRHPADLHWGVIVKRAETDHHSPDRSVTGRRPYRPRPAGIDLIVADDKHTYADWAEYLANPVL